MFPAGFYYLLTFTYTFSVSHLCMSFVAVTMVTTLDTCWFVPKNTRGVSPNIWLTVSPLTVTFKSAYTYIHIHTHRHIYIYMNITETFFFSDAKTLNGLSTRHNTSGIHMHTLLHMHTHAHLHIHTITCVPWHIHLHMHTQIYIHTH